MGICLFACNFKIYNVNGTEAVLDVMRYLSFGSGDIVVKVFDICSSLTFNIANESVSISILSQNPDRVLYFCNTISILTGEDIEVSL